MQQLSHEWIKCILIWKKKRGIEKLYEIDHHFIRIFHLRMISYKIAQPSGYYVRFEYSELIGKELSAVSTTAFTQQLRSSSSQQLSFQECNNRNQVEHSKRFSWDWQLVVVILTIRFSLTTHLIQITMIIIDGFYGIHVLRLSKLSHECWMALQNRIISRNEWLLLHLFSC